MGKIGTKRTFEPVKLSFRHSREVFEINLLTGESIRREKATKTIIWMDAEMELQGLKQGFVIKGDIHEKDFDKDRLDAKVRAAAVAGIAKRVVWDFFRPAEITVNRDDPEDPAYEGVGQLDDLTALRLEEQAKAGNAAANAWKETIEEAKQALEDPQHYLSKLSGAVAFIDTCTHAANTGDMEMWCREKMAHIRGALADLRKRRNPNHPGYRSQVESIRGWLYSWPVVNSWHQEPPRRQKESVQSTQGSIYRLD